MADREEYLEACREAKDSLYAVLMMSEPDTGHYLRLAYGDMKKKLDGARRGQEESEARTQRQREINERVARTQAWRAVPRERREAYVFQCLGDDKLTISELWEQLGKALQVEYDVYETHVRSIVTRMYRDGQLERQGEQFMGKVRYRYYRKRSLEGPIADLENAFDEGAG